MNVDKYIFWIVVIAFVLVAFCESRDKHNADTDPDRARFLLECRYDWMLSNEECHRLLDGGDPPEKPPEWTGC